MKLTAKQQAIVDYIKRHKALRVWHAAPNARRMKQEADGLVAAGCLQRRPSRFYTDYWPAKVTSGQT